MPSHSNHHDKGHSGDRHYTTFLTTKSPEGIVKTVKIIEIVKQGDTPSPPNLIRERFNRYSQWVESSSPKHPQKESKHPRRSRSANSAKDRYPNSTESRRMSFSEYHDRERSHGSSWKHESKENRYPQSKTARHDDNYEPASRKRPSEPNAEMLSRLRDRQNYVHPRENGDPTYQYVDSNNTWEFLGSPFGSNSRRRRQSFEEVLHATSRPVDSFRTRYADQYSRSSSRPQKCRQSWTDEGHEDQAPTSSSRYKDAHSNSTSKRQQGQSSARGWESNRRDEEQPSNTSSGYPHERGPYHNRSGPRVFPEPDAICEKYVAEKISEGWSRKDALGRFEEKLVNHIRKELNCSYERASKEYHDRVASGELPELPL